MTFRDDLDFAKQVVVLRDAFMAGEFEDYGYIKHNKYSDADIYNYTLRNSWDAPTVFRVNQYGFDGVSSFQSDYTDYHFYHHNTSTKMWIPEIEDWIPVEYFECTEEFHFQQSLAYSERTVKEMLTFAHLIQNPMPEKYQYFRMNMSYFDVMSDVLYRERKRKQYA